MGKSVFTLTLNFGFADGSELVGFIATESVK